MSLATYRKKRDFKRTAEPAPQRTRRPAKAGRQFVIQKHDASRLHYDLRLELGGAFKSWAVPKGLPSSKGEKHLAVMVEDHPLEYGKFEGTIPEGEYGGGTVMLWDRGTYTPLSDAPAKELAGGKLHFILEGEKLKGEWYLVRLREGENWLVIKGGEDMKPLPATRRDASVLSGRSMKQIAAGKAPAKKAKAVKKAAGDSVVSAPAGTKKAGRMPRFLEPMKARLVAEPPPGKWLYEIKFDGWRALAFRGDRETRLISRNDKDFTEKFPEIAAAVGALDVGDAILDGEIVAMDTKGRSSFQLLQGYDLGTERPPVFFYVFDLLRLNGKDLKPLLLTERKSLLETLLQGQEGVIRYSEGLGYEPELLLKKAKKLGLEGLIGKRPDSTYDPGSRGGDWIKLKLHQEQEFVIGGYTDPEGSRHSFGSLIIGYHAKGKFLCAGKVGTGFNHKLLRSLLTRFHKIPAKECPFDNLPMKSSGRWGQGITASDMTRCHWLKPKLVCQVKFSEWTRDGRLRQPVFLGLREDKEPAEVIRETAS